jgi:hypothetical protein
MECIGIVEGLSAYAGSEDESMAKENKTLMHTEILFHA